MRKKKNEKNLDRDNPAMAISSSDEDFDLPEPLSKERDQLSIKQYEEISKEKRHSEEVFRMNPQQSKMLFQEVMEKANKNIRYKTKKYRENNPFLQFNRNGRERTILRENLQAIKQKIFLNQLSPNRNHEYFHQFEPRSISIYARSNSINEFMNENMGETMVKRLRGKIKSFEYNFFLIINEVDVIFNKFKSRDGPLARKGAVSIDRNILEFKSKKDYNIDVYNLY